MQMLETVLFEETQAYDGDESERREDLPTVIEVVGRKL